MSGFVKGTVALAVVGLAQLAQSPAELGPRDASTPLADAVRITITAVEALFPEWEGHPRTFKITADFSRLNWRPPSPFVVGLVVQDGKPEPSRTDVSEYLKNVYLQVAADVYPSGALKRLLLNGRAVSETENVSMKELVGRHPDWSEGQIAEALQRAGAKYGPGKENVFLERLRGLDLRPIIADAKLGGVEFAGRTQNFRAGREPTVFLYWSAVFKKSASEGYALDFEPFGGKAHRNDSRGPASSLTPYLLYLKRCAVCISIDTHPVGLALLSLTPHQNS